MSARDVIGRAITDIDAADVALAALTKAGFAVVELPEPQTGDSSNGSEIDQVARIIHSHQYKGTSDGRGRPTLMVQCSCGHEEPCTHRQGRKIHSRHVAGLAAAILTAHAEAGDSND